MNPIAFTPPWQVSASAPPTETLTPAPEGAGEIQTIVAEDDPISREVISSLLAKWGFPRIVTQDGHEAMGAIRSQTGPVLAILDWMMPGLDGLQVCRRVRESERVVYIILLTARGAKENIVEGLRAGADDYLIKPFDQQELLARIQVGFRILNLHAALAERIKELEVVRAQNRELKMQLPL